MEERKSIIHYGWIVLAVGTLAVFGALGLARFGYSTVLPAIQADLSLGNEQAGLLATVNLAGYLVTALIGGALATRYGARIVVAAGLLLTGFGMLFSGWAGNFTSLIVWRGVTGIGSGAANIGVMGLWAAWFSSRKRGLASGIAVSGSSLALIVTGLGVPWILSKGDPSAWRICWFVFGGITLVLAVCSLAFIRDFPAMKGLMPIGGTNPDRNAFSREKTIWRQVYRSSSVWRLGLIYAFFGFSYIIYMTFFIKSLVSDGGYTGSGAGSLFMTMGWFSLLCGFIWGGISDRIGRPHTLMVLYFIHSIAFVLFGFSHLQIALKISAVLFGITAWSVPAIMAAVCGDLYGPEMAPAALGFMTLFFGIGQALGPVVAGSMADKAGSFSPAFWMASAVSFVGAFGIWFLKLTHKSALLPESRIRTIQSE